MEFLRSLNNIGSVLYICLLGTAFTSTPGASSAQSPSIMRQFEQEKHVGSPEEAIVGLEVTNKGASGNTETLHANGLVLRCDGFILAPFDIFDGRMSDGKLCASHSVAVVVFPGTDHSVRLSARVPANDNPAIGYVTIKVEDVHLKAVNTLFASAVQAGDIMRVVYSSWDTIKHKFSQPKSAPVLPGKFPTDQKELKKLPLGTFPFATQLDNLPSGAMVIGPESRCIGMVPGGGAAHAASSFLGLEYLSLVTNCVSPVPVTDAQYDVLKKDRDTGALVDVPGGPVSSRWTNNKDLQPDMTLADNACVAPFKIDKDEVTNARYYAFWKSLTPLQQKQRYGDVYPSGWNAADPPFGEELANTPVLGVTQAGAMAYATWAGKRLVTPAEWCLAAFGSKGVASPPDWVKKYVSDRNNVVTQIKKAHLDYVTSHPIMDAADFLPLSELPPDSRCDNDPGKIHGYDFVEAWTAPWIAYDIGNTFFGTRDRFGLNNFQGAPVYTQFDQVPRLFLKFISGRFLPQQQNNAVLQVSNWSKETVLGLTEPLLDRWKDPGYILPIGSREYDVSPFGVRDMVMNAKELVLASPFAHSTNYGMFSAMGVGWSEVGYPAALMEPSKESIAGRQGAFMFGTGRDGLFVVSGRPIFALAPQLSPYQKGSGEKPSYDPHGLEDFLFPSIDQVAAHLVAPPPLPLSRLISRTTNWPTGDLVLAAANLWHATETMSQLSGLYLFESGEQRLETMPYYLYDGSPEDPGLDDITMQFIHNSLPIQHFVIPKSTPIGAPVGLKLWADKPWRYTKEIAIETPDLSRGGVQGSLEGSLNYILPVGFRCAR